MAPRPRLGAELAWLLGVAPKRARKVIGEGSTIAEDTGGLPPLAAANIAAHRCAQNLAPAHPDLQVSFYARNNEEETLGLLNTEGRTSGFPEVPQELMHEALQELMHAFITGEPNPGRALLEILREHFIDGSNAISFLDELVAGSMNGRRTQSNFSKTQSPGLSIAFRKIPPLGTLHYEHFLWQSTDGRR